MHENDKNLRDLLKMGIVRTTSRSKRSFEAVKEFNELKKWLSDKKKSLVKTKP